MKNNLIRLFVLFFFIPVCFLGQNQPNENVIPDYSTQDRKSVPVEFTWRVDDIYKTYDEWLADKEYVQKLVDKVDEYAKDWTSSPQKMLALMQLSMEIQIRASKLFSYYSLQATADMGNTTYQAKLGELQSIFVKIGSKFSFFAPDVLALGSEKFNEYLKQEPKLGQYKFDVESILRGKNHILPAEQQKIVTLTGLFSGVANSVSSMLNDLEIPHPEVTFSDGKKVILNTANYVKYRASSNANDRTLAMETFWKNQRKFENSLALLQDAAIKQHYFSALVGKYPDCLTARLFGDNISTEVYYNLIKMTRKNLASLHKYLTLKKKMLKLTKFRYEDNYASSVLSVSKIYTYQNAQKIILDMMKVLGKEYVETVKYAFDNRWIDIYPNKGKESGAFSSGIFGVHPYIKLNYNGKYDAVSTTAHELGHTMHSYFSNKTQPYNLSQYPTFLAEIASTFNENVLMNYLLKNENDDLFKLYILDSYIDNMRSTLYRQTLFAEFELSMHKQIEKGEQLTADWLNNEYLKFVREYYGHDKGVCEVGEYIQSEWNKIPHFYMNYYVFQYSTGLIASMALTDRVLNGVDANGEKYLTLLKSGGNDYPLNILKVAGVDMTTDAPYEAAFKQFNQLVEEMEVIYDRLVKQGKL